VSYDFTNIFALSEDDEAFRAELVASYLSSFKSLPIEIGFALRQRDANGVRFAIHKVKAAVRLVNANELDHLLDRSLGSLTHENTPAEEVERVTKEIEVRCLELSAALRQAMNWGKD
jgi:hypothetical protein